MTSFDFQWSKSKNPGKGKVLAKKRSSDGGKKTIKDSLLAISDKSKVVQKGNKVQVKKSVVAVSKDAKPDSRTVTAQSLEGSFVKGKQKKNKFKTKHVGGGNEKGNFEKIPTAKDQESQMRFSRPIGKQQFAGNLVKRKQKKDKLAAKLATESGQNEEQFGGQEQTKKFNQNKSHSLFSEKYKNLHVHAEVKGKSLVEKVFSEGHKISELGIHKHLISNLQKLQFVTLTNVQEKSIPVVLSGKNVLVRSQTGSGKTLAYAVPIVDALQSIQPRLTRSDGCQAIVIVPTRELALQTHELFGKINTFQWIVVGHLCGGENRKTEKDRLRKGVHVLIATPGRLLDHILHTSALKTQNVRCLVLDEADRLLDMGFKRDIVSIVEELDKAKINAEYNPLAMLKKSQTESEMIPEAESEDAASLPLRNPKSKSRQTLLLSATLSKGIAELADFIMKDHIYIDALDESEQTNPKHMIIPNTVSQEFLVTYVKHRLFTLSALLVAKTKQNSKVFVFMATTQMVEYHYELFTRCLVLMPRNRGKLKSGDIVLLDDADADSGDEEMVLDTRFFKLHGNMDQSARKQIFTEFREAKKGVLLCTDVAARGLDVPEADCIIQYTGPQMDEDYIHRVGRTGRAGKSGSAILFLTHEEQDYLTRLQEYKVFLKKRDPEEYLKYLCDLMEEPDQEVAATALQKRYESTVAQDNELHRLACFAYSSWSRFYNTYPTKMRSVFNFKNVNLGHYVTSFAIRDTPTNVARVVRGQVTKAEPQRLNRKLATHEDDTPVRQQQSQKRKIKSVSLTTSEFSSGLEPLKKKKKMKRK